MRAPVLGMSASLGAFLAALAGSASADPAGGVVVDGSATISVAGQTTTIAQSTDKAIIEWQTFNVAGNEKVDFVQPSRVSITLNRVLGSGPSMIDGMIDANGRVFIINGDGVVFGAGAKIDASGLLAASTDIANANFMSGNFVFDQPGSPTAAVINRGTIDVREAGMIAFVAPKVQNSGVLKAFRGKAALGSGEAFTLDFFGDQLIVFAAGGANGSKSGEILVDGEIRAESGVILLTATTARDFIDTVINVEADLVARSASRQGGKIILVGGDQSMINVAADLDASGTPGGSISIAGGKIDVAADAALLTDAKTGLADGGDIFVHSSVETKFAGLASSEPGASSGVGGDITLGSDGVLIFTGTARAGTPPRAGVITLNGRQDDDGGSGGGAGGGSGGGAGPPIIVPGPPIREEASDRLTEVAGQAENVYGGSEGYAEPAESDGQVLIGDEVAFDFATDADDRGGAGETRLICLHGVSTAACGGDFGQAPPK